MDDSITLKGIKEGLLVTVKPEGKWSDLTGRLMGVIDAQGIFFRGAEVTLALGAARSAPSRTGECANTSVPARRDAGRGVERECYDHGVRAQTWGCERSCGAGSWKKKRS